ncbi:tRNA1(Val) (adenine(37)-N6)-methyltransferase [Sedimentitalea sp. HM32M-2]|uniref:tRNA1(Val) (adenine(37)-N6)-methyltransferase n=1 Tax=Sedimentitalea sp. HM32M-2 TaxID=3351566 RepID=UPI003627254E
MSGFCDDDLTRDGFLDGRLQLWQPRKGYRAGIDPVLLAASVPALPGQSVLELGCGAGAALMCLATRVADLTLCGVELQPGYAALAERNARDNAVELTVYASDLGDLPPPLRQRHFDHVIANPPYFRPGAHSPARDSGRGIALGENRTPLADWFEVAARRLAPRGYLHVIQRTDRLPDMLSGCAGRLGSVEVLPLAARTERAPDLVILRARKGGRAAFRLLAPCVLHEGPRHQRDGESYSAQIRRILRDGQALEWPAH